MRIMEWKSGEKWGNQLIKKLGTDERLFEEKRTNLKCKNKNRA